MANEQYHDTIQARTLETLTQINAAMREFGKGLQGLVTATGQVAGSSREIHASTLEAEASFLEISKALELAALQVAA